MSTTASIHKNKKTTLGRIKCFLGTGPVAKECSLNILKFGIPSFANQLYSESIDITEILHWALPGVNGSWQKYSFNEIVKQEFSPAKVGDSFGGTWSTHWFKISVQIPSSWKGKEIHLRWSSGSEAMLWNANGTVLGAFSPDYRGEYIISKNWSGNDGLSSYYYYVEMACNGMFGGMDGDSFSINPPDPNLKFTLKQLDIAVFNRENYKLYTDLEMLYGMATELPEDDHRGYQAMYTANEIINLIIQGNYKKATEILDVFFSEGNGQKAHTLVAMGHCHIDTAWLWTYDETIRKCARSWLSQIELMKEYPEFKFTCSQAQQFDWVKKYYPQLYAEIKDFVAQGRFVPVGGTWVEMDGLVPSGESFLRQFYYGQQFFKKEFGLKCKEFWLPDTFGYSGQIPQIMKHVGIDRFLTQKLSWSIVNKFPHHNFIWEGIDGSQVLVHFPPGDSYTMTATVAELLKSVKNSQDKGRANVGAYLFGHGDGGGGPTMKMIERLNRVKNVDGLPKVVMEGPDYLFEQLSKEKNKLCKWVGELYLELHNGTYTSQAKIKWYNRKAEFLLKEIELLISIAYVSNFVSEEVIIKDMETVDNCWKKVLLNQFHDVLPGSCIELVKDDAWRIYEEVFSDLYNLQCLYHQNNIKNGDKAVLFNPLSWDVQTVIFNKPTTPTSEYIEDTQLVTLDELEFGNEGEGQYKVPHKFSASLVNLKASGYSKFEPLIPENVIKTTFSKENSIQFNNGKISLVVEELNGIAKEYLTFKRKCGTDEDVFNDRLNAGIMPGMFYIYDDVPLFWDAWDCMDFHLETRQELNYTDKGDLELVAKGPLIAVYKWSATFGNNKSSFTRYTMIRADSPMLEYFLVIDWKESHKFLKVEFPVDILAREATFEIQYGHLTRPTHMNTSWDMAKFEVCGHKWMDISQADKGVTFITDSKYGFHVRDNIVQLSLLRSPKSPDGNCDIHKHFIHYAVLPHEGTFQEADVIRKAYEFNIFGANNVPILYAELAETDLPTKWVTVTNKAVIVEAVKVAAQPKRALCVRMYESFGGSATTKVLLGFPVKNIQECNGLEEPISQVHIPLVEDNAFETKLTPFQIKSFLVHF